MGVGEVVGGMSLTDWPESNMLNLFSGSLGLGRGREVGSQVGFGVSIGGLGSGLELAQIKDASSRPPAPGQPVTWKTSPHPLRPNAQDAPLSLVRGTIDKC